MKQRLKTGRSCQMRETLQDIYETGRTPAEAWARLHRLCSWMMHSRLEPMKDLARMIRRHWNEILAYFTHPYTNAVLEGADSVIQNIKRRARGFRNMDYFATMVYLTCGKLDLKAVTTSPSVRVFANWPVPAPRHSLYNHDYTNRDTINRDAIEIRRRMA